VQSARPHYECSRVSAGIRARDDAAACYTGPAASSSLLTTVVRSWITPAGRRYVCIFISQRPSIKRCLQLLMRERLCCRPPVIDRQFRPFVPRVSLHVIKLLTWHTVNRLGAWHSFWDTHLGGWQSQGHAGNCPPATPLAPPMLARCMLFKSLSSITSDDRWCHLSARMWAGRGWPELVM
jgi:hypothetical protein